jgi:hypothetical protein
MVRPVRHPSLSEQAIIQPEAHAIVGLQAEGVTSCHRCLNLAGPTRAERAVPRLGLRPGEKDERVYPTENGRLLKVIAPIIGSPQAMFPRRNGKQDVGRDQPFAATRARPI